MQTIISTENCQEAYNTVEECWNLGNGFKEEDGFDMETVQWSESAWEDEKSYFLEMMEEAIRLHEKRYGTDIVRIALAGKIGLWNGTPIGGRLLRNDANPLECMGNVDNISVVKDEDGVVTIEGHHHDGTHRMHVYLLSENMLDKINPLWNSSYSELEADDFIKIYETRKPLKVKTL